MLHINHFRHGEFWNFAKLGMLLITYLTLCLTVVHWLILGFQFDFLQKIPGWYWDLRPKGFSFRDLWVLLVLSAVFFTVFLIFRKPKKVLRNLVFLFILGWAIQISFGFVEGNGFASVRDKYFSSYHSFYAEWASQHDESVGYVLTNYEEILGESMFTSTKPPGVILIYVGLERLLNVIDPVEDNLQNYARLQNVITFVFPLMTFLIVFWLFFYTQKFLLSPPGSLVSYLSPLLYILAPDIVLIVLFLDQALYPSLFLAGTFLIILTFQKKKVWLALLTGCFLYLAVFVSFSMIPLLVFGVIYAFLNYFTTPKRTSVFVELKLALIIFAGIAAMFLIFQSVFNYDIFQRYQNAMQVVYNFDHYLRVGASPDTVVTFGSKIQHILSAIYLNNIEFALAVGIPVFVLFLIRSVKVIFNLLRLKFSTPENIQASFLGTFIALNAYGQMSGEAARLWMFWVPMVVIFAGIELEKLIKDKKWIIYFLLFLQLMTIFVTYKFQDLQM